MYYFVSDTHFGMDGAVSSARRERMFTAWLDRIADDAEAIFLVGDIFDFWYEFRRVAPKGFTRVLGKLGEITDRGITVHFFTGNHDMWMWDYLQKECGVKMHARPEVFTLHGRKVFVAHGDNMYVKRPFWEGLMQRMFRSKFLRWVFRTLLHPDWVVAMGHYWSAKSRKAHIKRHVFCGENEYLVKYAREYQKALRQVPVDYFIFGHIHCSEIYPLDAEGRKAVFLGEWLYAPSYAALDESGRITLHDIDTKES